MAVPYGQTEDGFELQFGTNHVGHFLLFQLLKDTLLKSSTPEFNSRVVAVSSTGHRISPVLFEQNFDWKDGKDYNSWIAYGQSKTANVWFANEIERRYGSKGLHALSLQPGYVPTNLGTHLDQAEMDPWQTPEALRYMSSIEQGAATSVYAAISHEWEGRGGKWLSNCVEQGPYQKEAEGPVALFDDGYVKWTYAPEQEGKLWRESLKLVGLEDDQ
jgi:NAD(P)-dependent dehydrogenase (short-subunit alcohol dehydrogenase family)